MNKNSKGITLIALVITIIVLLILAGVSLNLVAGGDGILGRATTAVDKTNEVKIAEEVELAMAELKVQYYEDKYVNEGTEVKEYAEYATAKLTAGIKTSNGILKLEDGKVNYYEGTNTTPNATGTFNSEIGSVTIGGGEEGEPQPEPKPEATKYTVSYDANGGTGNVPASAEYEEGKSVTVEFTPVPTKEGFDFVGWAETAEATTATYTSSGTTSFTMGTRNVTLYAVLEETIVATFESQIETDNYGEYVDLGTTLLPRGTDGIITQKIGEVDGVPQEQPSTDWRIFHEDTDGGIYLILADYLPYSYEETLGTGLFQYTTDYPYNWLSKTSRQDLLIKLRNTNAWNKLIDSTYISKGIEVKGALELETWVASWNAKDYIKLFINTYSNVNNSVQADGLDGYYVGKIENPETNSVGLNYDGGYGDSLYFPHKNNNNPEGYVLSSPSVEDIYNVMFVTYKGELSRNRFGNGGTSARNGIRPTVYIPAGINAKKVGEIWYIK